ncbi:hypothetical protein JCM6882_004006 [Rhodosporidiobolus microsporus]
MCRNVTSLVYGLPVRTYTLARAADAWPSLEPAFRFFDLVALRLRKGELTVRMKGGGQGSVKRIPVEVWMLVRDELIDLELEEAERGLITKFCCDCAYLDDDRGADTIFTAPDWGKAACASYPCECCGRRGLFDWKGVWENSRSQRASDCLAAFNLALPPPFPLCSVSSWTTKERPWIDPANATFVSLQPPSSTTDWTVSVSEGQRVEPDEQAVLDLSFDAPSLPAPFLHAAVRTLRLEPLTVLDDTRTPRAAGGLAVSEEEKKCDSRFSPLALACLEPRWMLMTTCRTEY